MYAPNHTDDEEIRKKVIIYKQEVEDVSQWKSTCLASTK